MGYAVPMPSKPKANPTSARRHEAAHEVVRANSTVVRLPVAGEVMLPPPQHLAWYAGLGLLVALEMIEWPVALVLSVGKALADNRHNKALEDFGEALEEAG